MKNLKVIFAAILLSAFSAVAQTINVIYTTDVHGSIFPYDFTTGKELDNSLSHVCRFVESVRDTSDNVIVLDNGDFLQGTPASYYYNFVDTRSRHLEAQVYNYIGIDALTLGNHDIETGHDVYDRVRKDMNMPWLAANVIDTKSGEPYFQPYTIVERSGKRIAIIGLLTPNIPNWLSEHLWQGMAFEDMVESAAKWVKIVREKEKPDVIIGLFHSGYDYTYGGNLADMPKNENASVLVAERVDGFDAILIGHDHGLHNVTHKSPSGHDVVVLDAGTAARNVGLLSIGFGKDGRPMCSAKLVPLKGVGKSEKFDQYFARQRQTIVDYASEEIGVNSTTIRSQDALFGNAFFMDISHGAMLSHTGADISFSAPLMLNAVIEKGELTIGQMFNIYRYENMLNVIELTGEEVKRYLEYSHDMWISNPKETGHLLNINENGRLIQNYYNFDSACGIIYTVNPMKEKGNRVEIVSMASGDAFDMTNRYKVALNSYRYNGGGGHLERGVGLSKDEIARRLVKAYDRDLRAIMIDDIRKHGGFSHKQMTNWKFVPEKELQPYLEKDMQLFGL